MAGAKPTKEPEILYLRPSGGIPNHPGWPVLVYRGLRLAEADPAEAFERTFASNGWGGCWRWGVYDFNHFHSNAHEALGVARGEAAICLGGPDGSTVKVRTGDLVVLPAGTGHKKESASGDFLVVGAYPHGQENYDLRRGDPAELDEVRNNIGKVPIPDTDPAFGPDGPLKHLWK